MNSSTASNRYKNTHAIQVNPPLYSQVAPMHEREPSMTSTTMVEHVGWTAHPQVEVRNPHHEQEYVDWKHQFQSLGNAIKPPRCFSKLLASMRSSRKDLRIYWIRKW